MTSGSVSNLFIPYMFFTSVRSKTDPLVRNHSLPRHLVRSNGLWQAQQPSLVVIVIHGHVQDLSHLGVLAFGCPDLAAVEAADILKGLRINCQSSKRKKFPTCFFRSIGMAGHEIPGLIFIGQAESKIHLQQGEAGFPRTFLIAQSRSR